MSKKAVGIDIGGTGIKGALVSTKTGELRSERIKLGTPEVGCRGNDHEGGHDLAVW